MILIVTGIGIELVIVSESFIEPFAVRITITIRRYPFRWQERRGS